VNGDDIGIGLGTDDAAAGQRWTYSTITNYTEQVDGVAQDWVSGAGLQTRDNVSAGATGNFSVTITRGAGAGNSGYSGIVVAIAASIAAGATFRFQSNAVTLGGQFVTISQGSLGSDHSVTLSGSVITTALGAVKAAASVPLLGAQIATQQGSLGIAGDVTVSINGQFVTVQQGTLTGDSGLRLTPGVDKGKRPTKLPVNWPLTSVVQDIANNSPLRFGPVSASATGQVISISQGRLEVSSYRSREAQRRDIELIARLSAIGNAKTVYFREAA
jgi:hypothetical protein